MGFTQSYLRTGIISRIFFVLFGIFLLFQVWIHLRNFNSDLSHAEPLRRLLIHVTPNRSSHVPRVSVANKFQSVDPAIAGFVTLSKQPIIQSDFNVTPLFSTGSEVLNYPLHLDFPELVRRITSNLSVSAEPINRPEFKILVSNPDKCKSSSLLLKPNLDLLILVKSAPSHFTLRDAIRLGWGNEKCWGGRQIVRLFLMGQVAPIDSNVAVRLQEEIDLYNDIIQQDFVDHYYNNTYKIMFGLEWTLLYCANAPIIMFVDDDFFVYPRNVVAYIEGLSEGIRERLISGYVWSNAIPIRTNRTKLRKWFIDKKEYPDSRYPPYVAAGNFFVSIQMAQELFVASQYTRYLRFDDVFLGIILKKLIRIPIHLHQIHAYTPVNQKSPSFQTMISSHQFSDPVLQLEVWDRLNCSAFCVGR